MLPFKRHNYTLKANMADHSVGTWDWFRNKRDKTDQIDDEARLFWRWIAIFAFDVFARDILKGVFTMKTHLMFSVHTVYARGIQNNNHR